MSVERNHDTLLEIVTKEGKINPNKVAIIFNNSKIRYKVLEKEINKFASGLVAQGLNRGIVALYLPNTPHFVVSFMGALKSGAKVCVISPTMTSDELDHVFQETYPELVITHEGLLRNIQESQKVKKLVVAERKDYKSFFRQVIKKPQKKWPQDLNHTEILKYEKLLKLHSEVPQQTVNLREPSVILYTTDKFGEPVGVTFSQSKLVYAIENLRSALNGIINESTVVPVFLPLSHISSLLIALTSLSCGGTIILIPSLDYPRLLYLTEKYNANFFYGSPLNFEELILIYRDYINCVNWRRMRAVISTAPCIPKKISYAWEMITKTKLGILYGEAETGITHINLRKDGDTNPRICGTPLHTIEARIVDPATLKFLPPGEIGELVISGPQIMLGYWRKPPEIKNEFVSIDGKNWLRTGALGYIDEKGLFYYLNRIEDVIRVGGENILPSEIEDIINEHPMVIESAITWDEGSSGMIAYVVPLSTSITEKELIGFLASKLPEKKLPERIEFTSGLPKSELGEISRRELKDWGVS